MGTNSNYLFKFSEHLSCQTPPDAKFYTHNKMSIKYLRVQSCKLHNNKYMIASTQITDTKTFAFIAVLVFELTEKTIETIKK